ncbi:hypothetical protein [Streptomyces sp. SAI-127]|uniref:hypothetical protein n=1 Tax=Streptomyces sp. SAI-127 TaxID=2940543 RepID=UPI0024761E67|nr:hypothetical protein [Streptomyces sp. SAI-127]MDH6487784.1 ribosomal protein S1 [Streptomyces sp. SAI-127]
MNDEEEWRRIKETHTVGSPVTGIVAARFPFGFFVKLDGISKAQGFVDVISYNPPGESSDPEDWPEVGERIDGVVADLVDRDHQVRIRVGPPRQ